MLSYSLTPEGDYLLTETRHSWTETVVTTVIYKKDLSMKKVHNDPWRKINEKDIEWFEKYYRKHFQKAEKKEHDFSNIRGWCSCINCGVGADSPDSKKPCLGRK